MIQKLLSLALLVPSIVWACNSNDSYSAVICADGPFAYFRFDENPALTMTDATGNAHGTSYNISPTGGQVGALAGSSSTSVKFDSSAAKYGIGATTTPFSTQQTGSLSIECWLKETTLHGTGGQSYGGKLALAGVRQDWVLFTNGGSPFVPVIQQFQAGSGSSYEATGVGSTEMSTSYHYFTFTIVNGTRVRSYGQGVLDTTNTSFTGVPAAADASAFHMGNNGGTGVSSDLTMDECAFYNYELTGAQVLHHYNTGIGLVDAQRFPFTVKRDMKPPILAFFMPWRDTHLFNLKAVADMSPPAFGHAWANAMTDIIR